MRTKRVRRARNAPSAASLMPPTTSLIAPPSVGGVGGGVAAGVAAGDSVAGDGATLPDGADVGDAVAGGDATLAAGEDVAAAVGCGVGAGVTPEVRAAVGVGDATAVEGARTTPSRIDATSTP